MEGSICRPGARIRLPDGKLVDWVRSNLVAGETAREMSRRNVGMSREVFLFARKLVLIKDRQVMTVEEDAQVDRAFQILESGEFTLAVESVKDILAKYWQDRTRDGVYRPRSLARPRSKTSRFRDRQKILNVFDRTLFAIRETCSTIDELKIPEELNRDGRDEAADVITESICALAGLLTRIRNHD